METRTPTGRSGRARRPPARPRARGSGGTYGLWRHATRSEPLLIRSAIHQDWSVPTYRRPRILAEVATGLDGPCQRHVIATARVFLTADRANLAAEPRPLGCRGRGPLSR